MSSARRRGFLGAPANPSRGGEFSQNSKFLLVHDPVDKFMQFIFNVPFLTYYTALLFQFSHAKRGP